MTDTTEIERELRDDVREQAKHSSLVQVSKHQLSAVLDKLDELRRERDKWYDAYTNENITANQLRDERDAAMKLVQYHAGIHGSDCTCSGCDVLRYIRRDFPHLFQETKGGGDVT